MRIKKAVASILLIAVSCFCDDVVATCLAEQNYNQAKNRGQVSILMSPELGDMVRKI